MFLRLRFLLVAEAHPTLIGRIPASFTASAFWSSEHDVWFSEEGRREEFAAGAFGRATNREIYCQEIDCRYRFSVFQSAWTRTLVASSITISSGQGRVNPSVAHFRVASIPIFEP